MMPLLPGADTAPPRSKSSTFTVAGTSVGLDSVSSVVRPTIVEPAGNQLSALTGEHPLAARPKKSPAATCSNWAPLISTRSSCSPGGVLTSRGASRVPPVPASDCSTGTASISPSLAA
jgi:hypothetical protein